MNRSRRGPQQQQQQKQFVAGGVYDPSKPQRPQNAANPRNNYTTGQGDQQQQPGFNQYDSQYQGGQQQFGADVQQQLIEQVASAQQVQAVDNGAAAAGEGNILKSESVIDENGKVQFKKIFGIRRKSSERNRIKKIRQNRRLRKAILPKNALMALHEISGIEMGDFIVNNHPMGGFCASVTVNNITHEGRGSSKMAAKNNACEKALRDFVIAKMKIHPRIVKNESDAMDTTEGSGGDAAAAAGGTPSVPDETDDVPMINLASFAIYKLFAEWESQGYVVPEMHPAVGIPGAQGGDNKSENGSAEPKKNPGRTELPPNWEAIHPATLLCMMRPGLTYNELGTFGEKPNELQKVSIVVDKQTFSGTGRSKKVARRNAAVSVCNQLFGTNFNIDA